MKWTIKLVFEAAPGSSVEHELGIIERADVISPATVGLAIAEGKTLLANLQEQLVTAQVQQHMATFKSCPHCGNTLRTKGHYNSTLRSVYGKVAMRVRRLKACPCSGGRARSFSTLFTNKSPITPELRYVTAKTAALLPFRKAADFLGEFLPLSARATTSTGFDGGYVKNRHRRPERNFEVVAGKVLDGDGKAKRFAFVRNGGSEAVSAVGLAFRRCGLNEATSVTVLTDGDAGLRTIHQQVAPHADHILDWFHCLDEVHQSSAAREGHKRPCRWRTQTPCAG